MHKKRLVVLIVLLTLATLLFSTAALAATGTGTFAGVLSLMEDLIKFVGGIFTLPILSTPGGAYGFIMFLLFIMIFTVLYLGGTTVFGPGAQRQAIVISLALSLITVIMLNFQRTLVAMLLGNWIYFFALVVLGAGFYAIHTQTHGWTRALLMFFLLLFTLVIQKNIVPIIETTVQGVTSYSSISFPVFIGIPLAYFLRNKKRGMI